MTAHVPSVLMLGVVAVQLGAALLFLNRMAKGHWWGGPGARRAVRSDLRCLRRDTLRLVRTPSRMAHDGTDVLVARLDAVEQNLERGQDAGAAEAVQWFQWEVLNARAAGTLSRDTATRLIDDAQALCEDLWARERSIAAQPPTLSTEHAHDVGKGNH